MFVERSFVLVLLCSIVCPGPIRSSPVEFYFLIRVAWACAVPPRCLIFLFRFRFRSVPFHSGRFVVISLEPCCFVSLSFIPSSFRFVFCCCGCAVVPSVVSFSASACVVSSPASSVGWLLLSFICLLCLVLLLGFFVPKITLRCIVSFVFFFSFVSCVIASFSCFRIFTSQTSGQSLFLGDCAFTTTALPWLAEWTRRGCGHCTRRCLWRIAVDCGSLPSLRWV